MLNQARTIDPTRALVSVKGSNSSYIEALRNGGTFVDHVTMTSFSRHCVFMQGFDEILVLIGMNKPMLKNYVDV